MSEEQEYYQCDECGKKISEKPIALSVKGNSSTFCSLECFFKYLMKKFQVIVKV